MLFIYLLSFNIIVFDKVHLPASFIHTLSACETARWMSKRDNENVINSGMYNRGLPFYYFFFLIDFRCVKVPEIETLRRERLQLSNLFTALWIVSKRTPKVHLRRIHFNLRRLSLSKTARASRCFALPRFTRVRPFVAPLRCWGRICSESRRGMREDMNGSFKSGVLLKALEALHTQAGVRRRRESER